MKWYILIFLVGITRAGFGQVTGQAAIGVTLPVVALLDIEPPGTGITLAIQAITEAGNSVSSVSNSTLWLNYTSAVATGSVRSIMAHVSSGTVPAGLTLGLGIGSPVGAGAGARAGSRSELALGAIPQTVLNGIGGAYTGNGVNNGHPLTFTLRVQDFGKLKATQNASLTITFTFVDL